MFAVLLVLASVDPGAQRAADANAKAVIALALASLAPAPAPDPTPPAPAPTPPEPTPPPSPGPFIVPNQVIYSYPVSSQPVYSFSQPVYRGRVIQRGFSSAADCSSGSCR